MDTSLGKEGISKRADFLRKAPMFSKMRPEDLEVVAAHFYARKYRKREIVFHEGDDSRTLYVVWKGKVRIFSINPAGNETSIRLFSTRDVFGEFAAIDGLARCTTAQAMEDCVLLEMGWDAFSRFLRDIPELSMGLIGLLIEKIRLTTDYAQTIAQYETAGRLLHIILQYAKLLGKEIEAGKCYELDLSMNQADLASLVGARREWVNRILREWGKRGLIAYGHGKIRILDLPAAVKERDRRMNFIGNEEDGW